eukprot:TRINITY_DN12429_c0_g1_i1.p1 TRINITY_DN12429_c0_g1~~TRINITY_DN12429_c0_g1_i1.p1  ORF type:complete len:279 (+),score=47.46 TRINITY_DN12429_c0_g1_i1:1-837(+)
MEQEGGFGAVNEGQPLKGNSPNNLGYVMRRVSYPSEWQQIMVKSQFDEFIDICKFVWRKFLFYAMLGSLLVYLNHFPYKIKDLWTWVWICNILWFEIDIRNKQIPNDILIQTIHPISFIGSFSSLTHLLLLLIYNPDFIDQYSASIKKPPLMTWLWITWMVVLPPLWNLLDLFLHVKELRKRHRPVVSRKTNNTVHFLLLFVQCVWRLVSSPVMGAFWFLFSPSMLPPSSKILTCILILLFVNVIFSTILIFALRKVSKLKQEDISSMLRKPDNPICC